MNLVFTICSVNYLAGAKSLAQSIALTNPDTKFVYVIADKLENKLSRSYFGNNDFIEVDDLQIPKLQELIDTYNIIEFNTAIKPFAIEYLHKKYKADKIIYFDPDIIVFGKLDGILKNLNTNDFILTPHILQPITDNKFYKHQQGALNTGIFNLGFIAINYNQASERIIKWWAFHMRRHGHSKSNIGEFYDQKIMNLLPIFSNKVLIEKNPGYNVAGWNIHERQITKSGNLYYVNDEPLLFYHFSGIFQDSNSDRISRYNQLTTNNNQALIDVLNLYRHNLENNNHQSLKEIPCSFNLQPNIHKTSKVGMLKHKVKKWLK